MAWHRNNLIIYNRAMELAFDVRKYQHSGREKLVPPERLEQKLQMAIQVADILRTSGVQDFPEFQRRLSRNLSPQDRIVYERLIKRLEPAGQATDPTLEVYSIILLFTGSYNEAINISDVLYIAHLVATMRDYARAFVILCKYGLEAGKAAFAGAAQSAKLVNDDIIYGNEKLIEYASRAACLLKLVATMGLDPDPRVTGLSAISDEQEQGEELHKAMQELYLRRLVSLFFERLCDAIMLHDGLLAEYLAHVTNSAELHADETAKTLTKAMMNAWYNINTTTSVNMIAGTDSRRDSWTQADPRPSDAVQLLDEMKARIGISATVQEPQMASYDLEGITDLYSEHEGRGSSSQPPSTEIDVQAQLQDIDRIFVRFLPYAS